MKQITARKGKLVDQPESVADQRQEYRGFIIYWERPPIPPGYGCEWGAYHPDLTDESGPGFGSDTIDGLKEQIDEYWEDHL